MNRECQLSIVTQTYLDTFSTILNSMIHKMTNAGLSDSISYNFVVQMIPHHRAAIEMSQNILRYTTNIAVQNIALRIISEQTKSIEDMQKILCRCSSRINSPRELQCYQQRMNQIMRTMFSGMENACTTNDVTNNFMREMIPHHRGAVEMSETTLRCRICPELRPILHAIITSQKRGIMQMEQLLRCGGCM